MTSLNFNYFPKGPFSKHNRTGGSGFNMQTFGGHNSVRNNWGETVG